MRRTLWSRARWSAVLALALSPGFALTPGLAQSQEPAPAPSPGDQPARQPDSSLLDLDIEQLGRVDVVAPSLDVEVTSVSRSESTVGKSPAAIFVITNEMIQRSAAREIPEILRMVPGMNVQRITGNKWAVSIRGFNSRFSNKLLVQIDGRSVYNPLFAGVYWDVQDVVLEDVDRIEVIRGPGATVWGANAVNGIINIITKKAADTQGTYVEAGAGDEWTGYATARRGGKVGDISFRTYGKWFERDGSILAPDYNFGPFSLGPARDGWRQARGGFRADWEPDPNTIFTLQGEVYDGVSGQQQTGYPFPGFAAGVDASENVRGGHILSRMSRKISDDSDWSVQFYYDKALRQVPPGTNSLAVDLDQDMVDLDTQYRFRMTQNQEIICGFGYRNTQDLVTGTPGVSPTIVPNPLGPFGTLFVPDQLGLDTYSYFVQDKITLIDDRWFLTIGSKFSHYTFADFEMQPSIRFLLTPDNRHTYWAAVSRAVRFPSRADRNLVINTPFFGVIGNPFFRSEDVLAYELGARGQPTDDYFWDVALFYNDYSDLSSVVPVGGGLQQLQTNPAHEQTYGFEVANTAVMREDWTLRAAYSFFRGSVGTDGVPRNTFYMMSTRELTRNVSSDVIYRYVDAISAAPFAIAGPTSASAYFQMDARLAWRPNRTTEWYIVGRNLLDKYQSEAVQEASGVIGSEVPREVYAGMNLRY